ncbi:Nitrogen assimilation transcription factor nit-4 [Purpureocillium lavendulum]|uniref:Nitrogen assimilation transcription factor nit-4 n=1 Tax=Purpureocillium lavendulum TaxID=1247861 RepID=A0AB34FBZ2_9HYPO|nr:Nitrogen assimilation transcription factor nit-4 [Purpureocillium lavendulum]
MNTGAACWDCAKNGHTCKPLNKQLKLAQEEPNDAWSQAAQQAAQQMRACGPGAAASSAASGPLHVLPPDERKLLALETIAEAARLWIELNTPDEDEENG